MEKRMLICPNCKKEFEVDEASYADLLNQVRTVEFNKELNRREDENRKILDETIKRIRLEEENRFSSSENEYKRKIDELNNKLNHQIGDEKTKIDLAIANEANKYKDLLNKKDKDIIELNNKVNSINKDFENEIEKLKADRDSWKNYRMGDSTKDLGESLENYCYEAFEEIHSATYPNATFIKDNDASNGSKGDFIFRDFSSDKIELTSIMFDMKTEKDTTATKHKNEDFLAKLDKDRTSKNCEYAVLVTTLEANSMLYNKGIVDVSHKYPKMFVVRPQHFLTIISLIRNMANKTYEYKKQVIAYQNEHLDITNFEEQVKSVAGRIANDYKFAEEKYNQVDEMCDNMIKKINSFRESFRLAYKHISSAQNKLEDLSIRKLTKNNPTMKSKFDEIANKEKKKDK